jgi:hypothetical protein
MTGRAVQSSGDQARDWLSAHLFYQGSLDQLLRQLVSPLVGDLRDRGRIAGHFFLRYWQGGPHVRLRLLPRQADAADEIRDAVRAAAERFYATYPAPDHLDPAVFADMSRAMARIEPDAEAIPLQPNHSVLFTEYRPEHHKYGRGAALAAVEQHFEQSSALVLEVIGRELPPNRRRVLAFAALAAAAAGDASEPPRFDRLAGRLDQVWRMWGAVTGLGGAGNAKVTAAYAARRTELGVLAASVWRRPRVVTGEPFMDGWGQSIEGLWQRLAALDRGGELKMEGRLPPAAFAVELPATAYAVDNCAHLVCNRLGIGLPDEWFLRGLVACAANERSPEPA